MYEIWPQILIIIGISGIIIILTRRLPHVPEMNVEEEKLTEKEGLKLNLRWLMWIETGLIGIGSIIKKSLVILRTYLKKGFAFLFKKISKLISKEEKSISQGLLELRLEKVRKRKVIDNLFKEARKLISSGKFEEAEKFYINIITLEPKNTRAYKALGAIYLKKGNWQDAKESFDQVSKLDDKDDEVWANLGLSLEKLGNLEKARHAFERAVKLNKNCVQYSIKLGDTFFGLGFFRKALANYQKATQLDNKSVKALEKVVQAALRLEDKNLVKGTLERILGVEPTNRLARDKLRRIREKEKKVGAEMEIKEKIGEKIVTDSNK